MEIVILVAAVVAAAVCYGMGLRRLGQVHKGHQWVLWMGHHVPHPLLRGADIGASMKQVVEA